MYSGVLFDVDDTLYSVSDVLKGQWSLNREQIEETGVSFEDLLKAYDEARSEVPYRLILKRTAEKLGKDESFAKLLRMIADAGVPGALPPYVGVRAMLTELKAQGIQLGVITNGDRVRQEAKLKALGIDDLFDMVMVCDGLFNPFKPEVAAFKKAALMLGVEPHLICMVGDRSDNDLAPAIKLGMGAIRIQLGNHRHQEDLDGVLLSSSQPVKVWEYLTGVACKRTGQVQIPAQRHQENELITR